MTTGAACFLCSCNLRHDGDGTPKTIQVDIGDVVVADEDAALVRLEEAIQQANHRGFSAQIKTVASHTIRVNAPLSFPLLKCTNAQYNFKTTSYYTFSFWLIDSNRIF